MGKYRKTPQEVIKKRSAVKRLIRAGCTNQEIQRNVKADFGSGISTSDIAVLRRAMATPSRETSTEGIDKYNAILVKARDLGVDLRNAGYLSITISVTPESALVRVTRAHTTERNMMFKE